MRAFTDKVFKDKGRQYKVRKMWVRNNFRVKKILNIYIYKLKVSGEHYWIN